MRIEIDLIQNLDFSQPGQVFIIEEKAMAAEFEGVLFSLASSLRSRGRTWARY